MGGLFAPPTSHSVDSLLSVELERPKAGETNDTARSTRVVLLRKEPSGRFALQQRLPLPEKTAHLAASFALLPNGNALCGVFGLTRVYELEPNASADAFTLKAYQLPGAYRYFCGFRVGSEWRLAVSFEDDSARVFTLTGGALSEVCRLPPFGSGQSVGEILSLRPGALCVCSHKKNPATTIIDYVEFDPRGNFLTPRRLLECNGDVYPLATLAFGATPYWRVALVSLIEETKALQFHELVD